MIVSPVVIYILSCLYKNRRNYYNLSITYPTLISTTLMQVGINIKGDRNETKESPCDQIEFRVFSQHGEDSI